MSRVGRHSLAAEDDLLPQGGPGGVGHVPLPPMSPRLACWRVGRYERCLGQALLLRAWRGAQGEEVEGACDGRPGGDESLV